MWKPSFLHLSATSPEKLSVGRESVLTVETSQRLRPLRPNGLNVCSADLPLALVLQMMSYFADLARMMWANLKGSCRNRRI